MPKIVAIVQLYNEIFSGYLEQFCKHNLETFDEVIVYDDGSSDGTAEYCRQNGFSVIRNAKNDFTSEVTHKNLLIEAADQAGADFIVSLDADEILVVSREEIEALCNQLSADDVDGYSANCINLWRSNCYKRTDSLFDDFKPVKFWRHLSGVAPFTNLVKGLHQRLSPDYVKSIKYSERLIILHTGFSTKDRILDKFVRYRSYGQSGFELIRFVDESKLLLERVNDKFLPAGWPRGEEKPIPLTIDDYFQGIEAARERVYRPKVTIFSLIYKDTNWLWFLYEQFLKYTLLNGVEFYFVANDANDTVLSYLRENYIPFFEFRNSEEHRKEHYINNVYRAWNFGVSKARGDFVLMLNSDMAFSEGWFEALVEASDGEVCVASRLIEQGKLKTGKHGIEKNFGDSWESFDEAGFQAYAESIRDKRTEPGGLYMPLLVRQSDFWKVGGYPEGNIVPGSDIFNPVIAEPGGEVVSGDTAFIEKLEAIGVKHVTSFDSVVYHFQEGEKRANSSVILSKSVDIVSISNNSLAGINGEKVLWGHLLELPSTVGLDYATVGGKTPNSFVSYISQNNLVPLVALQNATFVPRFFSDTHTLMYLQDNLRAMGMANALQEENIRGAERLVANTVDTAASYPEYDFEICPVGVDASLFRPLDKNSMRTKYDMALNQRIGVFVGALDDVKGWSEVLSIIDSEPELSWIVVTKYDDDLVHPRIKFFSKQPQEVLVELLNCADFFVLGSPVETQCLAAIEAALCDIPVIIKPVGVFADFSNEEKNCVGRVGRDLYSGVCDVAFGNHQFSPRDTILKKGMTLEATAGRWCALFARECMHALHRRYRGQIVKRDISLWSKLLYRMEVFYRFSFLKPIIKRDTFYSVAEISVSVRKRMPAPVHKVLRFVWRLSRGKF